MRFKLVVVGCVFGVLINGQAANFVVTNTLSSGPGSLSDALEVAATNAAGDDVITFAIPGAPPFVIAATSSLPELKGRTLIDGTSQAGWSSNAPAVVVNGSAIVAGGVNGFNSIGSENVIRGLKVERFSGFGILLSATGGNAQSNRVEACHAFSNGYYGIGFSSVSNSVIGGVTASNRNVVSGNSLGGINLDFGSSNMVAGNWVGVSATNSATRVPGQGLGVQLWFCKGAVVLSGPSAPQVISGNSSTGLKIDGGGSNIVYGNFIGCNAGALIAVTNGGGVVLNNTKWNRIGGTLPSQQNFISGNGNSVGIDMYGALENSIQGNIVGANATSYTRMPNSTGIRITTSCTNNLIGGNAAGEGNVISGNSLYGIQVGGSGNRVVGNRIGMGLDAITIVSNVAGGVVVSGFANEIGGTNSGSVNYIAGNGGPGIMLNTADSAVIRANSIGLDILGVRKPNQSGVQVTFASRNCQIGTPGAGNVISGNLQYGILFDVGSEGNIVQGNMIGLSPNGLSVASNGNKGIYGFVGTNNVLGGTSAGAGNVIAGNGAENVMLSTSTKGWLIAGNYIGLGADGLTSFFTQNYGPGLTVSGSDHIIGGTSEGAGNVISCNSLSGLLVLDATNVTIQGNYIGLGANGRTVLFNGTNASDSGLVLGSNVTRTLIGGTTSGARNVVVSPWRSLDLYFAISNTVRGNFIGLDASGTNAVTQVQNGITLQSSSWNLIGGTNAGEGNVVYGNTGAISLSGPPLARGNIIQGNLVNLDRNGNIPTTNLLNGINLAGGQSNFIGGAGASAGNIILCGGSVGRGVALISTNTRGNIVQGNRIGVRSDGTTPLKFSPQKGVGIYAFYSSENTLGGTNAGEGNIIAYCAYGIDIIGDTGTLRNASFGNIVYSNRTEAGSPSIGINLNVSGDTTTPNDNVPDADVGINNLQNFPVITNAISLPGSTRVQGYLASSSNSKFRVEFFYSDTTNAEGRAYLGATNIVTTASGTGTFTAILTGYAPTSKYITATATDTNNNTSEFCPGSVKPLPAPDADLDGIPDFWETLYGLNPNSNADATNHLDADGVNNLNEYLAGTIPNNASSYLRITALSVGDINLVSFPSSQHRNYNLEAASAASNNATWTPILTNILGSGLQLTLGDAVSSTSEFYRVRSILP